jgi:hypothetical protein
MRFLGLAGFYRRYVPHYSKIAEPLLALTHKGVAFTWGPVHEETFKQLKDALQHPPALTLVRQDSELTLMTDASTVAIGAVLQQRLTGERGWRPCCFYSRLLSPTERRYSTYEGEMLAVRTALGVFRPYLTGRHFELWSDHQALARLLLQREVPPRVLRWLDYISTFDFTISYIKGTTNAAADALSRPPGVERADVPLSAAEHPAALQWTARSGNPATPPQSGGGGGSSMPARTTPSAPDAVTQKESGRVPTVTGPTSQNGLLMLEIENVPEVDMPAATTMNVDMNKLLDEIRVAQRTDKWLLRATTGPVMRLGYGRDAARDLITFGERVAVPSSMVPRLLEMAHRVYLHPGQVKM